MSRRSKPEPRRGIADKSFGKPKRSSLVPDEFILGHFGADFESSLRIHTASLKREQPSPQELRAEIDKTGRKLDLMRAALVPAQNAAGFHQMSPQHRQNGFEAAKLLARLRAAQNHLNG